APERFRFSCLVRRGTCRVSPDGTSSRSDALTSAIQDGHMPELRKDPIVGRWVIIAHERAKRPTDFSGDTQSQSHAGMCPLCEGSESATPPEILAFRSEALPPNSTGWRVRVVPNKFPALSIEGDLDKRGDGIYDLMAGVGSHEVIVESPRHLISMAE